MARKKKSTRRRRSTPKRRSYRRKAKSILKKSWLYSLISIPIVNYLLKWIGVLPSGYEVEATLIGAGAGLYMLGEKKAGEYIALAGVGLGLPKFLGGYLPSHKPPVKFNVWG